ncbi:MAG TPA: feruloyl-CoA synthase [Burkholderiaceae bacterium]|nr:feruloyl-CoA synthase [Burkholderiaceae bacterium]
MNAGPQYRSIRFGDDSVDVTQDKNGNTRVTTSQPLNAYPPRMTDRLLHWAEHAPQRSFMAKRDGTGNWRHISYAEALASARRIGQGLLNRGLSPERPVVILSDNDLEHAMLALGCQYAGIPYAPISPAYSLVSQDYDKLRHVVGTLTPGLIFASNGEKFARAVRAVVPDDVEFVVTEAPPSDRQATLFSLLDSTPVTAEIDAARASTGPDTIAKFLFTSGSTKQPKAVINTERMLCSNQQMILQCWPFLADEPPVLLDWLPWNHTFGGNHNVGITLYNGGTMYIDEGKPSPQLMGATLANLREIAPTIYFNVPKGWEEIARALETDEKLRNNFHSRLKMQFFAGAALAQPVWDQLHAIAEITCGERIVMTCAMGMTESAPGALYILQPNVRAGQIGVPAPGLEIKLAVSGDKQELRYRGPNITPGYWRSPEQTREAFDEDGFFCSGDAVKWFNSAVPNLGFMFDGRIAEDFKLCTGTWVSVGPLRSRVVHEGAPYVQDAIVTGHDRNEIGLMILPNMEPCRQLAGLGSAAPASEVLAAAPVRSMFQNLLDRLYGQGTGSANRVTRAIILVEAPSIDKGEITDKGSVNQRAMLTHRAALVDALYGGADAAILHPSHIRKSS